MSVIHSWRFQSSQRCGSRQLYLGLRYGPLHLETGHSIKIDNRLFDLNDCSLGFNGSKELACGSQAFIATLLFDPSMSALPIIPKQNSVSVGLFTH